VVLGTALPAAAQPLTTRLTQRLDRPPLDRHLWGIAVLDARGRLLFGRNHERLFIPASNAKLVVTAVAASLLPPDWRVRTSVYAAGPVVDGEVQGDLVLYGRGDPTWGRRCYALDSLAPGACVADPLAALADLAAQLTARGIRAVRGDVVGDGSYFEALAVHPTWENDDLVRAYAAPVGALGFNENAITVTVTPGPLDGDSAGVTLEPDLGAIAIENRVVTAADTARTDLQFVRVGDGWRVLVTGSIPRGGTPRREPIAVPDGNRYAAWAFRRALGEVGIAVGGGARGEADSTATREARAGAALADADSRPLQDWIFAILNVSQNWHAEMLLKHLGRQFGAAGSWKEGLLVERRFLIDSMRVDSTQFLLHDGSGLSAKNLISPLAVARLLRFMRRHPHFPIFAAGLPQSGQPGSLRSRFQRGPLDRRVRAKTGSIGQVNTLSGYVESEPDGAALSRPPFRIFSVQANHHALPGRTMIQAIDSVVLEVGRRSTTAARR
jgi:D-alanyl-D-alanine carboxypeptidase/D-alanyl-D-alanine-endopeptidase (penicillin-binding protein 4)